MKRFCIRKLSSMSKDPAFSLFLDECSNSISSSGLPKQRSYVGAALSLLEEENTVPFIARYRREQTGDLPVGDLYELQRKWDDFLSMTKLRNARLSSLEANGKCTSEVRTAFMECISKEELEELYSSFKENKTAKSEIMNSFNMHEIAQDFIEGKLPYTTISSETAEIAKNTKYSVAEAIIYHCTNHIYTDLDVKAYAKEVFNKYPTILNTSLTPSYKILQKELLEINNNKSDKKKNNKKAAIDAKPSELNKYRDYHNIHRRITLFPSHQLLAIRRGKEAGVLAITLSSDETAKTNILHFIHQKYKCFRSTSPHSADPSHVITATTAGSRLHREDILAIASKEVISKLCTNSTRKSYKEALSSAEVEAAVVFATSLRPLLLTAPLRSIVDKLASTGGNLSEAGNNIVVCAVDPGYAHGHKWVILSQGSRDCSTGSKKGSQQSSEGSSSTVQAQGEDTTILCYGKIFENASKDSTIPSSVSAHANPVMLHSSMQFAELLKRYNVRVVAIGNGTASREAQEFVSKALEAALPAKHISPTSAPIAEEKKSSKKRKHNEVTTATAMDSGTGQETSGGCLGYVVVSEAGASVYSASERAREEFPPQALDIAYVGAVSIGRRLVDPLSELVKVQPASLGVGMYQHDLTDKGISDRLREVVEDCVNTVGIDINTASSDLLRYVSGLSDANVREIIAYRTGIAANSKRKLSSSRTATVTAITTATTNNTSSKKEAGGNRIQALSELLKVKGIGPKTYRNCAGFMRVYSGTEPLDVSNIHPDDYDVARAMITVYSDSTSSSSGREENVRKRSKSEFKSADGFNTFATMKTWEEFLTTHPTVSIALNNCSSSKGSKVKKTASNPYELLRSRSSVELEQIFQWLLEARLLPGNYNSSSSTDSGNGNSGSQDPEPVTKGPFMSVPKILRSLPADFSTQIEVGSVVHGILRNVTTFGAFVDLGGAEIVNKSETTINQKYKKKISCDGLLHCSKYRDYLYTKFGISKYDTTRQGQEIYVGREAKVKILAIEEIAANKTNDGKKGNHDKQRISLDLIELL